MREKKTLRRVTAMAAALSITVSMAAPAFAGTYYIDYGDITITKNEDGSQTITQGGKSSTDAVGEETIITTESEAITTLLPEAEDRPVADAAFEVPDVPDADQPDTDQTDADQPAPAVQQSSGQIAPASKGGGFRIHACKSEAQRLLGQRDHRCQ